MGIKIVETTANSISAEYYESISDGSSSNAAYLQWTLDADGEATRSQRTSDQSNNYAVTFTGLTAATSYYLTGTLYDANGGRIEGSGTPVTTSQGDKTVTIYANDGTGQSVSNTFPFGTTITIPDLSPVREDFRWLCGDFKRNLSTMAAGADNNGIC